MEIYNGIYCIYAHINKTNGKIYLGQTGQKPEKRWQNGHGYEKCPYFWKAICKYGWDGFEHEIIASNLTKEEADNFEKLLIDKLNLLDSKHGYNLKEGGANGSLTEETKQKIRESHIGQYPSEETRKKISESKIGEKNNFYGKHHSEESRRKISKSNIKSPNNNSKTVYQYDLHGNFIKEWRNMTRMAEAYKVGRSTIMRYARSEKVFMNEFILKLEKT